MFSVRKTTKWHGNTNLTVLLINIIITWILFFKYGSNYLVIFCSSLLLHLLIETGLAVSGIRKGNVYAFGKKLPRVIDILLKASVEGPAFCVSAFFVADSFENGNELFSVITAVVVVGLASLYMGLSDKKSIENLKPADKPVISRRAMTKPKAVMLLALINTCCISAMFMIPNEDRLHAFTYLFAYAGLVLLFYFINYNLSVRYIEMYNPITDTYTKPKLGIQIAGLTYDSAYEMALLVSPAYWLTYYLGFFS
jgi:hypothetical protein